MDDSAADALNACLQPVSPSAFIGQVDEVLRGLQPGMSGHFVSLLFSIFSETGLIIILHAKGCSFGLMNGVWGKMRVMYGLKQGGQGIQRPPHAIMTSLQ